MPLSRQSEIRFQNLLFALFLACAATATWLQRHMLNEIGTFLNTNATITTSFKSAKGIIQYVPLM